MTSMRRYRAPMSAPFSAMMSRCHGHTTTATPGAAVYQNRYGCTSLNSGHTGLTPCHIQASTAPCVHTHTRRVFSAVPAAALHMHALRSAAVVSVEHRSKQNRRMQKSEPRKCTGILLETFVPVRSADQNHGPDRNIDSSARLHCPTVSYRDVWI